MQIVIYTLLNYINCCIKQNTDYEIAKCLLLNIRKLSNLSLEDTAILCNVSVSTLNRFLRNVGFNNFSTVKRLMKNHDLPFNYESLIDSYDNSHEYVQELVSKIENIERIDISKFERTAQFMVQAQRIYLLGYGDFHFPASYFQNVMLYHGKLLEIVNQNERFNDPIQVDSNDLIIITSLSGGYVKNMSSILQKMKCRKVLITNKAKEEFGRFDCILELGENGNQNINKYLIMRVFEKLASSYYFLKSGQKLTR